MAEPIKKNFICYGFPKLQLRLNLFRNPEADYHYITNVTSWVFREIHALFGEEVTVIPALGRLIVRSTKNSRYYTYSIYLLIDR